MVSVCLFGNEEFDCCRLRECDSEAFVLHAMTQRPTSSVVGDVWVVHKIATNAPFYNTNALNVIVVKKNLNYSYMHMKTSVK
jgi:hypothetical protein